jgi:hypothetical protein
MHIAVQVYVVLVTCGLNEREDERRQCYRFVDIQSAYTGTQRLTESPHCLPSAGVFIVTCSHVR